MTDEYGTARGVRAPPPTANAYIAFPIDAVLKRIDRGVTGFFWEIFQIVKRKDHHDRPVRGRATE